jgi:hypothetical protein
LQSEGGGDPGLIAYLGFHLRSRERARDRGRFIIRRLGMPSTEDWRLLPLPPALFPLYHLLHPVLLAVSHVPSMRERIWPAAVRP